jgi:radical SAM protein with 4Fe4S-binding SPASM domain
MTAPPLPRALQIEVTGACNLTCRMCLVRYRPRLDRNVASVDLATFKAIVDTLPDLEEVTLQGLGEPLMAPDLFAMIEHASARGVRTIFNTNATLITRAVAERLVDAAPTIICISLDGATAATYESIRDGASFTKVVANVRGLVDVLRARGADRPQLRIVFVAMRRNVHELPVLVRLAADLGIGDVRVQNLSHSFADTDGQDGYRDIRRFTDDEALWSSESSSSNRQPRRSVAGRTEEAAGWFREAGEVARDLGIALRLPHVEAGEPARRAGEPACDWPWRAAYVRHDGTVQPCCMLMGDGRGVLGDLRAEPFPAVWQGDAYTRLREALMTETPPDICRGCSAYRGVF